MKIAHITTFPPRKCGIGTFAQNLFNSMMTSDIDEPPHKKNYIVAINDFEEELTYSDEVKFTIKQESQDDYLAAAKYINMSGANCCILQHEFGIFGGKDGVYILPLLYHLKVPFMVTLHTIMQTPSHAQKEIMQRICQMANRVVVMSKKAISLLNDIYKIPKSKIACIKHGVPTFRYVQDEAKKEFRLEKKKVLLTFGFLSRNKGIEVAIKAMPKVVEKHPDTLYIILGKTHPSVLRHVGEEYRLYLTQLIEDLELVDNVILLNEYTSQKELFKYLFASDIYITPYLNEQQISSGTLTYAVGAGSAVVSSPYWHAAELLSNGRGVLFDFGNYDALSEILIDLLDNPKKRFAIRKNAFEYGRQIIWPNIGSIYNKEVEKVIEEDIVIHKKETVPFDISLLPEFSIDHVKRLTDSTGIIQHAIFATPNLKTGYCLDDNARALLMSLLTYKIKKNEEALMLSSRYLGYIHYMQNNDGSFKNFMNYNKEFQEKIGSEDSFGRAIWAIGFMLNNSPNNSFYQIGKYIFDKAIPKFNSLKSIRSIANTIIGICHYLKRDTWNDLIIEHLKKLSNSLYEHYKSNSHDNWNWFEEILAYDNAILPLSLLHAAETLNDNQLKNAAFESMNFLSEQTMNDNYLSVIGNKKWFNKKSERSIFAQQPVDAMGMVLMFRQAYIVSGNRDYLKKLFKSFKWFLGDNDLRMSLYNQTTKGCFDGLESQGVNQNQGAESILAYLISYLYVLKAHEDYYRKTT